MGRVGLVSVQEKSEVRAGGLPDIGQQIVRTEGENKFIPERRAKYTLENRGHACWLMICFEMMSVSVMMRTCTVP